MNIHEIEDWFREKRQILQEGEGKQDLATREMIEESMEELAIFSSLAQSFLGKLEAKFLKFYFGTRLGPPSELIEARYHLLKTASLLVSAKELLEQDK